MRRCQKKKKERTEHEAFVVLGARQGLWKHKRKRQIAKEANLLSEES